MKETAHGSNKDFLQVDRAHINTGKRPQPHNQQFEADTHRSRQAKRHEGPSADAGQSLTFDETMDYTRKHMHRATRPFSRFIHKATIESFSDFIGRTIARPHAILAGGITSFIFTLLMYNYARYAGFALQGSETIIAFAVGWLAGLIFDLLKLAITRKAE